MASYLIAGVADDPKYAEAELLGDFLLENLPSVEVRKFPVVPEHWAEYLRRTTQMLGFQHNRSPLVWTEEGRLVGGAEAFRAEVHHKYGLQWSVDEALLEAVGQENCAAAESDEDAKVHERHIQILRDFLQSREKKMLDAEKTLLLLSEEHETLRELNISLSKQMIQLRALAKISEPPKPIKGLLRKADEPSEKDPSIQPDASQPQDPQPGLSKGKSVNFSSEPEEEPPERPLTAARPRTPAQALQHTRLMVKHIVSTIFVDDVQRMEATIMSVSRRLQDSGTDYVSRDLLRVYDRYPELFDQVQDLESSRQYLQQTCMSMDAATLARSCQGLQTGFVGAIALIKDQFFAELERRVDHVYSALMKITHFQDDGVDPTLQQEAAKLAEEDAKNARRHRNKQFE